MVRETVPSINHPISEIIFIYNGVKVKVKGKGAYT